MKHLKCRFRTAGVTRRQAPKTAAPGRPGSPAFRLGSYCDGNTVGMTVYQLNRGTGRRGRAWVGEVPPAAEVTPIGIVDSYWNNPGPSFCQETQRAAYEVMLPTGGRILYGLLGVEFKPHDYEFLRVCVGLAHPAGPYEDSLAGRLGAKVGLPDYVCGGVLAGALQDPGRLGQGVARFMWGAITDTGSAWEVFRTLAVGVVRLLGSDENLNPADLLPHFNGPGAPPPGGHRA